MRVLLTRPREDSELLARRLEKSGHSCIIYPLLTIKPVAAPQPDLNNIQAVMLTSAHALDFLNTAHLTSLLKLPCFCVGTRTADAAHNFGFMNIHNVTGDGLALAQRLISSFKPADGGVLHIAGRDTDSRGREAIANAGFTVTPWITYAAEAAESLTPSTSEEFRAGRIDATLLFSTRTATILKTLVLRHDLGSCCKKMCAIGISDMVLAAVSDLPWRLTKAAPAPTEDSVIQQLAEVP